MDTPLPNLTILVNPFDCLRQRARYKVFYGGRGGAKSWNLARALLRFADKWTLRILCAREFQTSIADSVHRLLCDQIGLLGLTDRYEVTQNGITNLATGSLFIFRGIRHNLQSIKSLEGIDICWVEEAQTVSNESWDVLIPTIRKDGSEIWVSFNTGAEDDPVYKRFVETPPEGSIVRKVGWADNPFFPSTLDAERRYLLAIDPEAYEHVWEGSPQTLSDAVIFRNRVSVETFETPDDVRLYFGADWGFANDPTALIRCWVRGDSLFVDHEAFGWGVEIDETAQLFDSVPGSRKWPIKADCARPETISYMKRHGFNISAARKWQGSIEDGIAHLKGFRKIVVHERCKHIAQEFRLYSYKVDKTTGDVLPIIVDKHNHGIDALRYSMDGHIKGPGLHVSDELLKRLGAR